MTETEFAGRYTIDGWRGIAWYVDRIETAPDEDTEWTGIEEPTGNVVCVMVGDDREFVFDPDDLTEVPEDDYCHECGQVGCTADGR